MNFSYSNKQDRCRMFLLINVAMWLTSPWSFAQKYTANQFFGGSWNTESGYEQDLGLTSSWHRTWWDGRPVSLPPGETDPAKVFARFPLHRYNPRARGRTFSGTHIKTNGDPWALTSDGKPLEFTARMRFPNMREGVLCAFFVYENIKTGGGSEIDVEVPMHLLVSDRLWLNIRRGSGDFGSLRGDKDPIQKVSRPRDGWGDWNTYTIRWTKNSVVWYLNGAEVRREPKPERPERAAFLPNPNVAMQVHLNIWAPPPDWALGQDETGNRPNPPYTPGINETDDPKFPDYDQSGRGNYFDVQWVEVKGGKRIKPLRKTGR